MMRALKPLLIASLAAFAAFAAWGAAAVSAAAFPDAQVDAELKPNFRALIYPPIHRHERYRYVRPSSLYRPAHPELYPYAAPAAALDLTVDCADPRGGPHPLSDALYFLAPGGTLHVRAGAACTDSLYIDKPVVIVGE